MSYEKHTWETGEIITAEKLNNQPIEIIEIKNNQVPISYNDMVDILEDARKGKTFILKIIDDEDSYGIGCRFAYVNQIIFSAAEYGQPNSYFIRAYGTSAVDGLNIVMFLAQIYLPEGQQSTIGITTADIQVHTNN